MFTGDDFLFDTDGVPFTLSAGDRVCYDVIVNDDDENEYDETAYFFLYLQSGNKLSYFTDRTRIIIHDNEEGLLHMKLTPCSMFYLRIIFNFG